MTAFSHHQQKERPVLSHPKAACTFWVLLADTKCTSESLLEVVLGERSLLKEGSVLHLGAANSDSDARGVSRSADSFQIDREEGNRRAETFLVRVCQVPDLERIRVSAFFLSPSTLWCA